MSDPQQLGIAREHATTRIPICRAEQPAGEVRDELLDRSFEYAGEVAVLAGNALVGLIPMERMLAAGEGARAGDLMDSAPPVVEPGADQEAVAWEMARGASQAWRSSTRTEGFWGLSPGTGCSVSCWPSTKKTWPA